MGANGMNHADLPLHAQRAMVARRPTESLRSESEKSFSFGAESGGKSEKASEVFPRSEKEELHSQ